MQPIPIRSSSSFPTRQQQSARGGVGLADSTSYRRGDLSGGGVNGVGGREASPLFRRTNNNAQQDRNNSNPGLQGLRQIASDATAASPSPGPTHVVARPRTTGSMSQYLDQARRQSISSIRSTAHSNNSRPPSGRQQQQEQPRLTRNITLGDLRWTPPAAVGLGGKHKEGRDDTGGDTGGGGDDMISRRGWQAGGTLGGGGVGAAGGSARPLVLRQSSNGHSRPGSPEVVMGGRGSRLPLLDSTPTPPQQQQTQRQRCMHVSTESNDLFEHGLSFGVSALKGRRPYMEDEFKVIPNLELNGGASDLFRREGKDMEPTHFFGMFDGHAGGRCSKALTHILGQTVSREPDFSLELQSAVHKGFLRANAEFLRKAERFCANDGSTAVTAFVRGRRLVVGNVGDSRAVLCSGGRALPMSSDHKPNKPEERRRIQALGGRVVYSFGIPRVNGILAVSRAFGDRNMKGAVNAEPDVRERGLERHDDFLVLATDGLWDVMSSQEVCNIVYNSAPDVGPQGCSELLTTMALRKGSLDNTSAMVVDLRGLWDVDRGAQPKRAGSVAVAAVDAGSAGTAILRQELKALSPSYCSSRQTLVNGGGSSGNGVEPDGAGAAGTGDRSRPFSSPGLWAVSQAHQNGNMKQGNTVPSAWNSLVSRTKAGGNGVTNGGGGGGAKGGAGIANGTNGRSGQKKTQQQQQQQQHQQQQLRNFSSRRGTRKGQQQQLQQQPIADADGATIAADIFTAAASSRQHPQESGAERGRGAGAEGTRGGSTDSSIAPWSKVMASKAWGMSVATGSAWSFAGGGSGAPGHTMSPPGHTNSTELAMSLYGGGGGGNRSRSHARRSSA